MLTAITPLSHHQHSIISPLIFWNNLSGRCCTVQNSLLCRVKVFILHAFIRINMWFGIFVRITHRGEFIFPKSCLYPERLSSHMVSEVTQ